MSGERTRAHGRDERMGNEDYRLKRTINDDPTNTTETFIEDFWKEGKIPVWYLPDEFKCKTDGEEHL